MDRSLFESYRIVSANFSLQDSSKKVWFLKEIFLLANTNIKWVLKIIFLTLSDVGVKFDTRSITWRMDINAKTMPMVKRMEIVDKHELSRLPSIKTLKHF